MFFHKLIVFLDNLLHTSWYTHVSCSFQQINGIHVSEEEEKDSSHPTPRQI